MQKIKEGALFAIGFTIVAITIGYAYAFIVSRMFDESDYGLSQPIENI